MCNLSTIFFLYFGILWDVICSCFVLLSFLLSWQVSLHFKEKMLANQPLSKWNIFNEGFLELLRNWENKPDFHDKGFSVNQPEAILIIVIVSVTDENVFKILPNISYSLVEFLVGDGGADISASDNNKNTALHVACSQVRIRLQQTIL